MALPAETDILTFLDWGPKLVALVIFIVLAVIAFVRRNNPRAGGKIGRRSKTAPPPSLPAGFSRVVCREIVNFGAPADAGGYPSLKIYVRRRRCASRGWCTSIASPAGARASKSRRRPHYDRIDARKRLRCCANCPIRASCCGCI